MGVTRRLGAALGAVLALSLVGCGTETGGPSTECTDETRSAGAPGDAEPLLVLGDVAFTPTIVYADGAVVLPAEAEADARLGYLHLPMMAPGFHGSQPGLLDAGWLSDCELAAVIERADALFTEDVDFGDPLVTDQSSTEVSYLDRSVSIYAFSRSDPTEWGGLSGAQEQSRRDLADLWTLVEEASERTGPAEVDRLFVHLFGSVADDEVVDWPLAVPLSQVAASACTTVADPTQVEQLLDRMLDGGALLESETWRLAVLTAAPGAPDCEG